MYVPANNNYNPFCQSILAELSANSVSTFLRNSYILSILGVSEDYGRRYACQLQVEFPLVAKRLDTNLRDKVELFQSVGGAPTYLFNGYTVPLTAYTTRYIYHACIIIDYLGKKYFTSTFSTTNLENKPLSLLEIGGGFGGLLFWIHTLLERADVGYHIIDLEEANQLQRECVRNWNITLTPVSESKNQTLFLISNYAYSEFNAIVQEEYKKNVIQYVDGGFMIWNNLSGITDFTDKPLRIVNERPYFPENDNKFIYF